MLFRSDLLHNTVFKARGIALEKSNGKPRPIVISSVFRNLTAGIIMAQCRDMARNIIEDHNFALTKGGIEALTHSIKALLSAHPDFIVLCVDVKNAFYACPRNEILRAASRLPALYPLIHWWNSGPNNVTFSNHNSGFSHTFNFTEGTVQGGPEGSALYSIAQASVLKALRAKFPDIFALSFHDDSYLIGKPERAFEAFKWLRKEFFESLHLELAKEKCTAFVPPSSFPEGALAPQFVEKRNTTAALASAHGISLSTTGIIATGVPIGSDSFIDNHLEEIAEQALETANKAQQLHGAALDKRYTLSLNRIFTLIRLCIPSQLTHLLRTVPPSRTRTWAREFDDSLSRCKIGRAHV